MRTVNVSYFNQPVEPLPPSIPDGEKRAIVNSTDYRVAVSNSCDVKIKL